MPPLFCLSAYNERKVLQKKQEKEERRKKKEDKKTRRQEDKKTRRQEEKKMKAMQHTRVSDEVNMALEVNVLVRGCEGVHDQHASLHCHPLYYLGYQLKAACRSP